ncbi:hypothetical protein SUGI_0789830 [Cryptomeria japonica]|nr:hypothetical protein SUGI_0789830 [Cryptomeria japonica]
MDKKGFRKELGVVGLMLILFVMLLEMSHASVVLIGSNKSFTFDDLEASFVLATKGSGLCGILQVAEPSDGCSPLRNKGVSGDGLDSPFALIERGKCSFESKIRNAQGAGFKAAIVYNNEDSNALVAMGGDSRGITIYAIFVSKAAGQVLLRYAGDPNMECWIIPSLNTSWAVMIISFASLVSMATLLAICVFIRKYWLLHGRRVNPHHPRLHGMSRRQVKALPSLIFTSVTDDNCTSETCAVCLEDYNSGEKLRVLPCRHKFHALCIDSWLTRWRTFCPVCKRDAKHVTVVDPPVTENTPLLSGNSFISSQNQSAQSSFIGSPSMHIPSISLLAHAESSHSQYFSSLSINTGNIGNASLLPCSVQSAIISSQSSLCGSPQIDSSFTLPPPIPSCSGSANGYLCQLAFGIMLEMFFPALAFSSKLSNLSVMAL